MFWMMGHITEILNKSVIIEINKKDQVSPVLQTWNLLRIIRCVLKRKLETSDRL